MSCQGFTEIAEHLVKYPSILFTLEKSDNRTTMQLTEITIRGAQVEENINKLLYNALIEMKYSNTVFSTEAFNIIDKKFSLWSLWYREIVLLHKYFIASNIKCDDYPEILIELAKKVRETYRKQLAKNTLGQLFIEIHSNVFYEFIDSLKELKAENGYSENVFLIGKYLIINLEVAVAEVLSIDSFLRKEDTIYIFPRIIRLKSNFIKMIYDLFTRDFKIKYFGFDPIVEAHVNKWLEEAELKPQSKILV